MSTAVIDYMYGEKVGPYYGYPPRNQNQTFHTPSFGDEEFDIPPINPHGGHHGQPHSQLGHGQPLGQHSGPPGGAHSPHQPGHPNMSYQHQMNDGLSLQEHASYQQPLYLTGPSDHQMGLSVSSPSYVSPQAGYIPGQDGQMLMLQQQQQHHHQMLMNHSVGPVPGQMPGMQGVPQYGRPAPAPGHSPPNTTTSEDSDDSAAMMGGVKRPSPEPVDQSKLQKKPKVQKKKKKRDPNEPQKPVSAYALFFRDTQAAIKLSNPNASFGEVSKIVASMWDALDTDSKNVYKKRTEAAKKDYLKALAAYRASLLSKGPNDQESNNVYGGGYPSHPPQGYGGPPSSGGYTGYSPPAPQMSSPPMASPQQHQMVGMNKQSNGSPQQQHSPRQQPPPQSGMMGSPMGPMGHMGQLSPVGYMQQPPQQTLQLQPLPPMPPHSSQHVQPQLQQLQHPPQHLSPQPSPQQHSPPQQQQPPSQQPPTQPPQSQHLQQPCDPAAPQDQQNRATCIRHGCPNVAVPNSEWEDEYCSNECVVSHCRDVFSSWVASNQNPQPQTYSTVK
ncbi:TOX high mobility group box family member 4-like isoform X1 [Thrips palmi]|uniref:TOX high mobility group box family member 4-like isoform X1 n=2 Tax=Thrips palmi TaxID=161013 RepID=A0A6P9AEV0_THRPL|nr:TOX high mobility group box family member 4-like isoform X1 [Thrips palmi]